MRVAVALTALLAVASFSGCGRGSQAPMAEAEPRGPVSVQVVTVGPVSLKDRLTVVGTVRAQNEVVVAARILSYIRSMTVREGDRVRAGQPLVVLDDRELRSGVEAARAAKNEAESAILAAEQGIATAQSQLHLAELTHKRYVDLLAKDSVSQQEFDVVDARLKSAKAALALAASGENRAQAKRAQADAAVAQAEVMLGYAVVTAPVSGVVTERVVDPGALAAPAAPLLRIEEAGAYRLEVAAPESQLSTLRVGQVLPLEIDALGPIGPTEGRIVAIVPAIDANSRTFTLKISLPSGPAIRSGQYGRAFLPGVAREALTVPASSVVERGQLRFVLVAEDERVRRRAITLGEPREGSYEVLSGLRPGDLVIVQPVDIRDGDPVALQGSTR